jgi:ABC-type protease/lipase transport system fused ATPase/permease subunit
VLARFLVLEVNVVRKTVSAVLLVLTAGVVVKLLMELVCRPLLQVSVGLSLNNMETFLVLEVIVVLNLVIVGILTLIVERDVNRLTVRVLVHRLECQLLFPRQEVQVSHRQDNRLVLLP